MEMIYKMTKVNILCPVCGTKLKRPNANKIYCKCYECGYTVKVGIGGKEVRCIICKRLFADGNSHADHIEMCRKGVVGSGF
jgi:hypothetical protein